MQPRTCRAPSSPSVFSGLGSGAIIFPFCGFSRLCSQENFPPLPGVRVRRSDMRRRDWARRPGEAPARSRASDLQRRPHRPSVHGLDFPVSWFFKALQPGKFSSPPRVRVRRSHMRPRREVARRWARQRGEAPARSRAWDLQRRPHRQSVHGLDFPVLWFFKALQPGKFSSPLRRPHSPVPCPTGPRGRSAPPLGSNGEARRLEARYRSRILRSRQSST